MKINKIYLYGASGHGKVVAEIAESQSVEIAGFVDENPSLNQIWSYPVLHTLPVDASQICLSVGNNASRKRLAEIHQNLEFPVLIHHRAVVSNRAKIQKGTVVMAGVTVNADVQVGEHCILNTNASIDHDCQLADFVHVSPNVALAGNVEVGEGAHIGIGASVIQGVKIGKWSTVGAGAVVIEEVPDFAVVVGNPARIIKYEENPSKIRTEK